MRRRTVPRTAICEAGQVFGQSCFGQSCFDQSCFGLTRSGEP